MGQNDHVERKPRKNTTAKQGGVGAGYDAAFRGYINLNLTDEQKEAWSSWAETSHPAAWLESAVADGVNIALRLDAKSGGFLASATQRREDSPNAGLCCTARARDPHAALSRLLYCIALLSEGETWEKVQPLANPDRW